MGSWSCVVFVTILLVMGISLRVEAELAYNYYKHSCPSMESIVRSEILKHSLTDFSAPAAFIRLLFHDCQVKVKSKEVYMIHYLSSLFEFFFYIFISTIFVFL